MAFISRFLLILLCRCLVSISGTADSAYYIHHGRDHHSLQLKDKAALLEFKRSVSIDPNSTLSNWEEAVHVCNFTRITCNKRHHRVVQINLTSCGLVGKISPFISNLTSLRLLILTENHFFGTIPPELSSLRHLHFFSLYKNHLSGPIPHSFSLLTNLYVFFVSENNLEGPLLPSFFSNCTRLGILDFSYNFFTGQIPAEIGNCQALWSLALYNNQFTGQLPASLANATLSNLDAEYNYLSGELPFYLVQKQSNLLFLHLSYNNMTSHDSNTNLYPFFTALQNCTNLVELELAGMDLGGRLPNSIGHPIVKSIELQENRIFGSIPPEIGNLSSLTMLNLTSNSLNGTIPEEVSRLSMLEELILSNNFFNMTIPVALAKLHHLGLLDLSNNNFYGEIPASLGDLLQLYDLLLNINLLSGPIPPKLLKFTNIYRLDLSYNKLTGKIPPEIADLREIRIFLNLSHNLLERPLPIELSKLDKVLEIDLSSNNLSGNIFPQISRCTAVEVINFSNNSLNGQLPDSLGDLRNLKSFDVSINNISGMIPTSLSKTNFTFLNLSYNYFEGMIPFGILKSTTYMSFLGNPRLHGATSHTPICLQKKDWFRSRMFLIIFIIVAVLLLAVCCVMGTSRRTERSRNPLTPEITRNFPRITYTELSEATGGFDDQQLIGTGSYGRVYKGVLQDGTNIAVKVLHFQYDNSTKSFIRECQVLKRIRHRNIIRIITACILPEFKAFVLPYMEKGSLDSHLYPHSNSSLSSGFSDLSLIQRLSICNDIAEGMAYLHHHSPVRVLHCDLKPSNVLLNDDMTALVSDFGTARLVLTEGDSIEGDAIEKLGNSAESMLLGSIGYIPPEYGFGSNISTKGDVYSFGVVVLEMVTRKRPTEDIFVSGLNLHRWVKSHYHEGKVEKVVDSSLIKASRYQSRKMKLRWEVAIGELALLGILCTQDNPSTRPTMLDAADDLSRLKRYLNGNATATFASSLRISSSILGDH